MIHLVGLPHTQFDKKNFSSCAFTAKAVRLVEMLRAIGQEVTVYWGGERVAGDYEHVRCLSERDQLTYFGEYSGDNLPVVGWETSLPYWSLFHGNCVTQIRDRIKPGDMIGVVGGAISQVVIDQFKDQHICLEPGVGYEGICQNTFACFESYAWMHNRYGAYNIGQGRAFDAVIPNAVDPADWSTGESEGYALFVGRGINSKGPHVAAEISKRLGLPLKMAGGGVALREPGRVQFTDGTVAEGDHIEHIGSVVGDERRDLFAHAEVFLCPTLYIGPWEGVHAEALMSGIPVIAPDYGVFTETIPSEFRYRNIGQAVAAYHLGKPYRGEYLRERAIKRFGIDRCTSMYGSWFERLNTLANGGKGWYA